MKKISILGLLILLLSGCFGGFPEITQQGKIEGYILDILTEQPIVDADVKIQDIVYATNEVGYFPLARDQDLEDPYIIPKRSGDIYNIKKSNYYTKTGTTLLNYGQGNLKGYITPKPANSPNYFISGTVYASNVPLEKAEVVINGNFIGTTIKVITDENGVFKVSQIPYNTTINVYAYKDGYTSMSKELYITRDTGNVIMEIEADVNKKYGIITGQISGFNNEICEYSLVSYGKRGSANYQFSFSDISGNYVLYGIPVGEAQLTVKSPGFYEPSPGSLNKVTVTEGTTINHNVSMQYIKGE